MPKRKVGRKPVGGEGVETVRLPGPHVPKHVHEWLMRRSGSKKISPLVRKCIMDAYEADTSTRVSSLLGSLVK